VTFVTQDRGRDGAELSAADEQLLRELTGQASDGELNLTSEGGLLGKLTKMAIRGELDDHLGMPSTNGKAAIAAIPAMGTGPRR
jgi:hypothetical protein